MARVLHYAGEGAASPAPAGVSRAAPPLPPSHTDGVAGACPLPIRNPPRLRPRRTRAPRTAEPKRRAPGLVGPHPSQPQRPARFRYPCRRAASRRPTVSRMGHAIIAGHTGVHGYQDGKEWVQNAGRGADPAPAWAARARQGEHGTSAAKRHTDTALRCPASGVPLPAQPWTRVQPPEASQRRRPFPPVQARGRAETSSGTGDARGASRRETRLSTT